MVRDMTETNLPVPMLGKAKRTCGTRYMLKERKKLVFAMFPDYSMQCLLLKKSTRLITTGT